MKCKECGTLLTQGRKDSFCENKDCKVRWVPASLVGVNDGQRIYKGEVSTPDEWNRSGRCVYVRASNIQEAVQKVNDLCEDNEDIYQVSRSFTDASCWQPIYDFFNGFFGVETSESLEAVFKADTWDEYMNIISKL